MKPQEIRDSFFPTRVNSFICSGRKMKFTFYLVIYVISAVNSEYNKVDIKNIGMTAKGLYHSLESIFKVFQSPKYREIPRIKSLMTVFESCSDIRNLNKYGDIRKRHVFVVIEGLQASGSRYFANRLVRLIKGQYLVSPPNCLNSFRRYFDQQNEELRTAFYALSNYIVAEQVKRDYLFKPVVINRYWHSQAAVTLSHEVVAGNGTMMPLRESYVYKWPKDLLKPDIVFLLTRQHNIRNPLWNEKRLVMTKYFRSLMVEAYLRMNDPPLIDVDGGSFHRNSYPTLRMLVNNTRHNLRECYKKYNLSSNATTNHDWLELKYII